MFTVIVLEKSPTAIRGMITRWMHEIYTNVYIGQISKRVLDELWKTIIENIGNGTAVCAYTTNNEQGFDFIEHNSQWVKIDNEGIILVKHLFNGLQHIKSDHKNISIKNLPQNTQFKSKLGKMRFLQRSKTKRNMSHGIYCVVDIETTGLSTESDEIIEVGAIKVSNNNTIDELSLLIQTDHEIPSSITKLTGITNEMIEESGVSLHDAITLLFDFIQDYQVVGHNIINFDRLFIMNACKKCGIEYPPIKYVDTLTMAKKKLQNTQKSYSLSALLQHFEIQQDNKNHRAIFDCYITKCLYDKLNEI